MPLRDAIEREKNRGGPWFAMAAQVDNDLIFPLLYAVRAKPDAVFHSYPNRRVTAGTLWVSRTLVLNTIDPIAWKIKDPVSRTSMPVRNWDEPLRGMEAEYYPEIVSREDDRYVLGPAAEYQYNDPGQVYDRTARAVAKFMVEKHLDHLV